MAISGLQIQGASFVGGKRLEPLAADAGSASTCPPAFFAWVQKRQPRPYPHFLSVPLYRTEDRSRVLFEAQLPLAPGDEKADWVLAGVALFIGA